jgi:FKBP-type peptidyl-prolyl cis-trans isomerase SlyD
MQIENGKVVTFHYTLTTDAGEQIDSSSGGEPMAYLHGAGNIVPGLERQMSGRTSGDRFDAKVGPEEGYGVRQGDPEPVPRQAFPEDVDIQPGMMFRAETSDGRVVPLWVAKVEEGTVWVDQNHPLAGENLNFAIEVVGVRDATDEEHSHGHVHGPGGHHH